MPSKIPQITGPPAQRGKVYVMMASAVCCETILMFRRPSPTHQTPLDLAHTVGHLVISCSWLSSKIVPRKVHSANLVSLRRKGRLK